MTLNSEKDRRGFSLLEILLALGLGAILAVAAVPSVSSWLAEYRLRIEFDRLASLVQDARIQADLHGEAHVVIVAGTGEEKPGRETSLRHVFAPGAGMKWTLRRPDQRLCARIGIDRRGYVDPVIVRVTDREKYIEGQFDFLTGHVLEREVSF